MKNTTKKTRLSLDTCLDILDWFNDPQYDYINHIVLSKLDGEQRVRKALPTLQEYCLDLIIQHIGMEDAYPIQLVA